MSKCNDVSFHNIQQTMASRRDIIISYKKHNTIHYHKQLQQLCNPLMFTIINVIISYAYPLICDHSRLRTRSLK